MAFLEYMKLYETFETIDLPVIPYFNFPTFHCKKKLENEIATDKNDKTKACFFFLLGKILRN